MKTGYAQPYATATCNMAIIWRMHARLAMDHVTALPSTHAADSALVLRGGTTRIT